MYGDSGHGAAIMCNSNNFVPELAPFVTAAIAREYGWHYTPQPIEGGVLLVIVQAERGTQATIDEYFNLKKTKPSPL